MTSDPGRAETRSNKGLNRHSGGRDKAEQEESGQQQPRGSGSFGVGEQPEGHDLHILVPRSWESRGVPPAQAPAAGLSQASLLQGDDTLVHPPPTYPFTALPPEVLRTSLGPGAGNLIRSCLGLRAPSSSLHTLSRQAGLSAGLSGFEGPFSGIHLFQTGRLSGTCLWYCSCFLDISQRAALKPPIPTQVNSLCLVDFLGPTLLPRRVFLPLSEHQMRVCCWGGASIGAEGDGI